MRSRDLFRHSLCVLALAAALQGCSKGPSDAELLGDSLAGVFDRGTAEVVRIADVTAFDWDQMFVFPPKSSLKIIFETLNQPVPYDVYQTHIFERDDINLLVFFRGDSFAEVVALDRSRVDIAVPEGVRVLSPSEAIFVPSHVDHTLALADQAAPSR